MHLLGKADAVLCNNKHSVSSTLLVASNINHGALISWQDLQKLHVIPKSFPAVAATACVFNDIKTKTIESFSSVFLTRSIISRCVTEDEDLFKR